MQGASSPSPPSGAGAANTILIDTLSVAQNTFGVMTTQGDGDSNTTMITGVTAPSPLTSIVLTPSIIVNQGRGAGDRASVVHSSLPGSISITQSDAAGRPGDSAILSGDAVGATATFGLQVLNFPGNLSIKQGDAGGDTASISNSTATGNASITQGNGGGAVVDGVPQPGDSATISGVSAGIVIQVAPYFSNGNITIIQGSGSGDTASVLNSTAVDNVSITQASVAGNPLGDTVTITGVAAGVLLPVIPFNYGNIVVQQGNANGNAHVITSSTAVGQIIFR
jgi:hypothetical protein